MSNRPTVIRINLPNALGSSPPPEVRSAADNLSRQGVPKDILNGRYRSAESVTCLSGADRRFLRFGSSLGSSICVDVSTGEVVSVAADWTARFVNSSLEKFVDTAIAVTAQFPFYGADDDESETERAVDRVLDAVRSIEPIALERDQFWSVLVDDIQMGDFVTERVVKIRVP